LESALKASVASIGDESDGGEQKPSREQTIQHDQGDLLDLTWSEKNSEVGTTKKMLQKSYPGLIPTALDTDYDTSDTDSISSSNSYPDSTERLDRVREITHDPTVQRFQQEQNNGTINNTDTVSSQPMANEEPSQECQTPASLIEAVIKGDATVVTILLESGFDVDTMEEENKRTGLMLAALLDHYRVLKVLLNKGANISAQDRAGRTALHFSAGEGYCK
jgi:hypothetical protein